MAPNNCADEALLRWKMANEMRVLFCALVTAYKRNDSLAFWATVEITKKTLRQHINISDEEWHVFRSDK